MAAHEWFVLRSPSRELLTQHFCLGCWPYANGHFPETFGIAASCYAHQAWKSLSELVLHCGELVAGSWPRLEIKDEISTDSRRYFALNHFDSSAEGSTSH